MFGNGCGHYSIQGSQDGRALAALVFAMLRRLLRGRRAHMRRFMAAAISITVAYSIQLINMR
jgi:hypothetical protein